MKKLTPNKLRVFAGLVNSDGWVDVSQLEHLTGVHRDAINKYLRAWTKENLLLRDDTFQAYLYRLADDHQQNPLGKVLAAGLTKMVLK